MKFDTKVVRAGITPDPTTGSILPPIYETATYVLDEVGPRLPTGDSGPAKDQRYVGALIVEKLLAASMADAVIREE